MAEETIHFEHMKVLVGGIRNDSAPTTYDEEPCVLRMNSDGELVVSFGTGSASLTQTEDAAHGSGDSGIMSLGVRNDTLASLVDADGDYAPFQVDANGALYVNIGGEAIDVDVEGTAAQDAAVTGNPMQMAFESADFDGSALPNDVDAEGDVVRPKASLSGVQYIMPVNEDGSATPLAPEGTVAGEGLQISLDDGTDTVFAQGDTDGNLKIVGPAAEDAAVAGNPLLAGGRYDSTARDLDDGDVGAIALDADANQIVVGNVAHDAVDLGAPSKIGARARLTLDTAVAEDDRTDVIADLYGRIRTHDAAFSSLSQSNSVGITNRAEDAFDDDPIAAVTDGADDTYYYYVDMRGYKNLSLDLILSGGSGTVTVTIEAAMSNGTTAKESLNYTDVTNTVFSVANWTASALAIDDADWFGHVCWVRVKVIAATAAAGDADWTILKRKNKA